MDAPRREFGVPEPDRVYQDRPAAFGVAVRDGRIALVKVTKPGQAPWWDLPGGAVDPGETEDEAVAREFGEEAALVVRPGETVDRVVQYFLSDGRPFRNHGPVMVVEIVGENPSLTIEDDHERVWVEPEDALRILRHDSHAWAVACWLRRQGRGAP